MSSVNEKKSHQGSGKLTKNKHSQGTKGEKAAVEGVGAS